MFYKKSQNSSFLNKSKVKMSHILPKRKNVQPNFLYFGKYMINYQNIDTKLAKCGGQFELFLPWTQN